MKNTLQEIDVAIFTFFNQYLTHPILDQVLPVVTDLHKLPVFWAIVLTLMCLWILRSGKWAIWLIVGAIATSAIADGTSFWLIKENVQRVRPINDPSVEAILRSPPHSGHSFPSNHAANTFALAAFFTFFYSRLGLILFSFAALIGYSRVYVGVHYPFDVMAGALWGVLWGLFFAFLLQKLMARRQNSKAVQNEI